MGNNLRECPLRSLVESGLKQRERVLSTKCMGEKCEWYIGYPYFETDCAINQMAYALMALASFGPKGAKEVS